MAERKGPGEYEDGPESVESGRRDGQNSGAGDASADAGKSAGESHKGEESRTPPEEQTGPEERTGEEEHTSARDESETAEVVALTPRAGTGSDETDDGSEGEDELVDLEQLSEEDLVDLSVLQADDALLDALGGTDPGVPTDTDDPDSSLEHLLVSWRRDVDATPIGELVDVDTAVATVAAATRRPRRGLRRWHLVPVASAAAVLMILSTGVGLAAKDALPGDMLWGVTQVLYSDHAKAAKAQKEAQSALDRAQQAWERGSYDEASHLLSNAHDYMSDVDAAHGLPSLEAAHESLANRVGKPAPPPQESSSSAVSSEPSTDSSEFPTSTSEPGSTETETSEPTSSEEPSETSSVPSSTSEHSEEEPSSDTSMLDSDSEFPGASSVPGQ